MTNNPEATIQEILTAQINNQKKELFEFSLSRIMKHVQNAKTTGFAILTSWRKSKDKPSNLGDFASLKNLVKQKGLGYVQLRGHWRECQDPNVAYDKCPPDQLEDSLEPILFVIGVDAATAKEWGQQFDQDAVLYDGPETNGNAELFFRDGSTMALGAFSPMTVAQAFTDYRATKTGTPRYFAFEGISYPAQTYMEKMIEQQLFKNIDCLTEGLSVTTTVINNKLV